MMEISAVRLIARINTGQKTFFFLLWFLWWWSEEPLLSNIGAFHLVGGAGTTWPHRPLAKAAASQRGCQSASQQRSSCLLPPAAGSPQRPLQIHVWTYKNALLSSVSRASLGKKKKNPGVWKFHPQTLLMRRWSILSGWITGRMLGPAVPATHNSPDWTFLIIYENAERLRLMFISPQFRVMLCTRVGVFFCLLAEIGGYSDQRLLSWFWSRSGFPRAACWTM